MSPAMSVDADPLSALIAPESSESFFKNTWEKQPAVFKATKERQAIAKSLFSLNSLLDIAKQRAAAKTPLLFGTDLNAARYVDGKRETPNGDVADSKSITQLFNQESCTLQVHQPQRFDDTLWRLCAALESQLGCLVGCNSYITPSTKQGLAPHFDDVEIFVLQVEGSKEWKVYRPTEGPLANCLLSNQPSGDLPQELIGEPILQVTLEVGDVLYLPRGTIHQACACTGSPHSSHLTLSTYQRWTVGDLAQHAVSVALADPQLHRTCLPMSLKQGLPRGFLYSTELAGSGLEQGLETGKQGRQIAAQLAQALRDMAHVLESSETAALELIGACADTMSEDFMRNRLPPHPEQQKKTPPELMTPPLLTDVVECATDRQCYRLVPLKMGGGDGCDDSDCDEDHDHHHHHGDACDDENCGHDHHHHQHGSEGVGVRLMSCLHNDRTAHMLSSGNHSDDDDEESSDSEEEEEDDPREDLVFPAEMVPALTELLNSKNKGIKIEDIKVEEPEVRQQVAAVLLAAGILVKTNGGDKKRASAADTDAAPASKKKKAKK